MRIQSRSSDESSYQPASGSDVDLRELGRRIWARRRLIILPTIIVGALATLAVNTVTPRYKSEARVLIEGRENVFLRPEADREGDRAAVDAEAMVSQAQVMLSRDLAREVIRKTKLAETPEYERGGPSIFSALLSLLGLAPPPMSAEERVLEKYYERLSVIPVEKSRVIQVEFQSADPALAAQVANAVVDTYLAQAQVNKIDQTRAAGQWLATEIANLRTKVAEAEGKVEEFRTKANLYVGPNNTSLSNQQLLDLTNQLATARTQAADAGSKATVIRNLLRSGAPIETSEIWNSDLIRRLVEQRVTLRTQLAEQSSTLLGGHPRIKELRAQISALDAQLRAELDRIGRSYENDAKVANARVDAQVAKLAQIKQQAGASSEQDVQLRALEREAKSQRDLLESYLAKYREATARESIDVTPTDARIISRASAANNPAFPKKLPIVVISMVATMFLMLTYVVTSELLAGTPVAASLAPVAPPARPVPEVPAASEKPARRRSILGLFGRRGKPAVTPDAAPAEVPVPVAAPIAPVPPLRAVAPVAVRDVAEAFRALGDAGRRIAAIGAGRNVGTTYTAIGLARALATDARVVLVDLAFGAPNLSVISTDPAAPGIVELIRGAASFSSIITRDQFSRVQIIATGKVGAADGELLSSPRLGMTLEALARAYDYVVIDAGDLAQMQPGAIARFAPRSVLVTTDPQGQESRAARESLLAAGFADVAVLAGKSGESAARAA